MLSAHFSVDEFTRSRTAVDLGIDNSLPPTLLADAEWFALRILEPIRSLVGVPVRVTSGYRCPDLNREIGGSHNSYHMRGTAADIVVDGVDPYTLAHLVTDSGIPFDKVILEFGRWVHVQGRPPARHRVLTALRVDGRTRYVEGLRA